MEIYVTSNICTGSDITRSAISLANQLNELGFNASYREEGYGNRNSPEKEGSSIELLAIDEIDPKERCSIAVDASVSPLEQILRLIAPDFDTLPLMVEGESKIIRKWTDNVVVIRPKPTVYSYTMNRYGIVSGTDSIRMKFSAALFRKMGNHNSNNGSLLKSAFLAEVPSKYGPLLVERKVDTCNLEVRIKRYQIGSPLHRYRYTQDYKSTQTCGPIEKWSRFDTPVVCFDWRNPLQDEEGNRLSDEPISDDYAAVWMKDVANAKEIARQSFLWMEELFNAADLCLIDLCLFIDYEGHLIYGEISPDCMRVHFGKGNPSHTNSGDKDVWRQWRPSKELKEAYEEIYRCLFGS